MIQVQQTTQSIAEQSRGIPITTKDPGQSFAESPVNSYRKTESY